MNFCNLNGNPWFYYLPDCGVRSLAIGFNMKYEKICKMYKVRCKTGYGLLSEEGASTFENMTEVFKDYLVGYELDELYSAEVYQDGLKRTPKQDHYIDYDLDAGFSIKEYVEMLPKGKYLFCVRPTREEILAGDKDWHMTFVDMHRNVLMDCFDCQNSLVYGYAQIKESSILSPDDPDSRYLQLKKLDYPKSWNSPNKVPFVFEDVYTLNEWKSIYSRNKIILPNTYRKLSKLTDATDIYFDEYDHHSS